MQINMLHNQVSRIFRILDQKDYFKTLIPDSKPEIGVKATPQKPVTPKSDKKKIIKSETVDYDSLPQEMKDLYDKNTQINGEMKSIHALMAASQSKEERAEYNSKLKELEDQKHDNWLIIDEWIEKHDATPANQPLESSTQMTAAELAKKIASAQKYLQRVEGKEKNDEQKAKVAENRLFLEKMGAKANVRKK